MLVLRGLSESDQIAINQSNGAEEESRRTHTEQHSGTNMKIIDKMNASIKEGRPFFSFEFFPPRTEEVWKQYNVFHRRFDVSCPRDRQSTALDCSARHFLRVLRNMLCS